MSKSILWAKGYTMSQSLPWVHSYTKVYQGTFCHVNLETNTGKFWCAAKTTQFWAKQLFFYHQFVPICSRDPQWATTAGTCYQCNQSHRSDWSLRYNPPRLPTLWPNHILAFIAEYTLTPQPGWLALSLSKNRINTQQASDYSPGWLSQFFSYLLVQGRQRVNSGPR